MTKIKEIIDKYNVHYGTPDSLGYGCFMTSDMISAMKEYAEWYAEQLRDIIITDIWNDNYGLWVKYQPKIEKIKLPDHESI